MQFAILAGGRRTGGVRVVQAARPTAFVLCVLAAGLAPGHAAAQSSVNITGLIDGGVSYVSNQGGHANTRFDDGIGRPNLLVFVGREDLGNGMAAVFRLENQYMLGSGSFIPQQSLFTRQAMMGLDLGSAGKLTLGKQYDFMVDSLFFGENDGASMFGAGLYSFRAGPFTKLALPQNPTGAMDWDRIGGDSALPNTVKYTSPNVGGFSGGVMYGFGGVAGAIGASNSTSAGLNYANGPFGAGAAYTNVKYDVGGMQVSVRTWGAGAHYAAGAFHTSVLFTTVHNSANGGGIWSAQIAERYQMSAAWSIAGAYAYLLGNDFLDRNHAHQFSASLNYAFSKRTSVYLSGAWQIANRGANAQINGLAGPDAASSTSSQAIVRIGMMTFF